MVARCGQGEDERFRALPALRRPHSLAAKTILVEIFDDCSQEHAKLRSTLVCLLNMRRVDAGYLAAKLSKAMANDWLL